MSDDRQPTMRHLTDRMNAAVIRADNPSLREMERRADLLNAYRQCLRRATLGEYLNGMRKRPPTEQFLAAFVTVLRVKVAQQGRDPDEVIGSVEEWLKLRRRVLAGLKCAPAADVEEDTQRASVPAWASAPPAIGGSSPVRARAAGGGTEPDGPYAELVALARRYQVHRWWQEYADVVEPWFAPYLSLEPAARLIHCYESQFIPGLLQTRRYAEAVIRIGHRHAGASEIERRIALRMARQRILKRPVPPTAWCVVDEAALRRCYGSPGTTREQLKYLLEVSHDPNVIVQVMPMAVGGYVAAAMGPLTVLRFAENSVDDVVYLEQMNGALYPGDHHQIASFGAVFDRLIIQACKPGPSRSLLLGILKET